MDQKTCDVLFGMLRSVIGGGALVSFEKSDVLEAELYAAADQHDIAHLIGYALFQSGAIDKAGPWYQRFQRVQMKAVYRYEQSKYELQRIGAALEAAEIPYVPLKGAVIRDYYPEPWLRTSCDLDVLVHEEDLERAVEALGRSGWSVKGKKAYHDISLYSAGGVHLELHFNIKENLNTLDQVLERVWDYSAPVAEERGLCYRQSNEFLMFHVLAHMSYHFIDGGCGVRSFLDVWTLRKALTWDEATLRKLCSEARILKFYEAVLALIDVWFGGGVHTELTRKMEKFVVDGGVYGSTANRVVVNQAQTGGRLRNLRNRIFMPLDKLKVMYPVLQRHGWLCPVFEVVRWVQIIASGRGGHAMHELALNQKSSKEQLQEVEGFLQRLGLNEKE